MAREPAIAVARDAWVEDARKRAAEVAGAAGELAQLRAWGSERLADIALPDRKTESWKYSRVARLLEEGLLDAPSSDVAPAPVPPLADDALCIALVDGVPGALPALPRGLSLERLSALAAGQAPCADGRPFVALNAALTQDGLVLRVAPGVRIDEPVELQLVQNAAGRACGAHPRVRIELGEGAELTLVERQLGRARVFTNSVIEAQLGAGARLVHHRIAVDAGEGRWLTALDVHLDRDARYGLHQALVGSVFRRSEIRIHLDAPGGHVEVGSASLSRDGTHLDTQICLEHAAPHCTSNQVFRAIAGEQSRTVLNGRIHIHRDAQKTAAELSTKNLLLSAQAEIDAKPELEIYADDVTCAHGATVGQLDPVALFYLRSRGIDEALARTMVSFAFIADVVAEFPSAGVRETARADLEAAFSAPAGAAT